VAFAALRHPDFRPYLIGGFATMMGDNVEHVISYWIIFQIFHSPLLAGYAIISHWLPFLLFSVYAGALADRFDCRRLIQISQMLFLVASAGWGVLISTDNVEVWHACVLLTIHGMAGVIGAPAGQLMIHDIVGQEHLQSGVRLNATARQLGPLVGPAIGGGLMILLGPGIGLLINAATYIPFTLWLFTIPYTGHNHASAGESRRGIGLRDMVSVFREVSGNRTVVAMVAAVGLVALIVGPAIQVQLPEFAAAMGEANAGLRYTTLQTAYAAGAVAGGVILEWSGMLRPGTQTAIILAACWTLSVLAFTMAPIFAIAVAALLVAGFFRLAFGSMAQALVQLAAPPEIRGRVLGLFNASQLGLQTGSGFTVGILGSLVGAHWSLGLSAAVLLGAILCLLGYVRGAGSRLGLQTPGETANEPVSTRTEPSQMG
jgi:MFS family permease